LICIKLTAAVIACREERRRCAATADHPAFTDVSASMLVMQRAAKLFSRMSLLKAASHPNGIFARSLAIAGGEFEFECSIFRGYADQTITLACRIADIPNRSGPLRGTRLRRPMRSQQDYRPGNGDASNQGYRHNAR
jgi:hypothetical protein